MAIQDMAKQLDELIVKYKELTKTIDIDEGPAPSFGFIANRLEAAIDRIAPPGSTYIFQLNKYRSDPSSKRVRRIYQVAVALRDDLKAGWVESVVELVHAGTNSDYLEMADELLNKGYKDAAAVITGTSLEVHIKALCVKHAVVAELHNGTPKKADVMNADLKKVGVYDGLQQKQLTAWMGLRNQAAHGDRDSYDKQMVRMFIDGVRAFMMKYPA